MQRQLPDVFLSTEDEKDKCTLAILCFWKTCYAVKYRRVLMFDHVSLTSLSYSGLLQSTRNYFKNKMKVFYPTFTIPKPCRLFPRVGVCVGNGGGGGVQFPYYGKGWALLVGGGGVGIVGGGWRERC